MILKLDTPQQISQLAPGFTQQRTQSYLHSCTMKLTALLSLFGAACSVLAGTYTIPEDLPDGTYLLTLDADGNQITTKLNGANNTDTASKREVSGLNSRINPAALGKRYDWPSGSYAVCPGGAGLRYTDLFDHVWDWFYNECKNSEANNRQYYGAVVGIYGTAQAYMCAYSPNICRAEEWGDAVARMRDACPGLSANGFMETGKFVYYHVDWAQMGNWSALELGLTCTSTQLISIFRPGTRYVFLYSFISWTMANVATSATATPEIPPPSAKMRELRASRRFGFKNPFKYLAQCDRAPVGLWRSSLLVGVRTRAGKKR